MGVRPLVPAVAGLLLAGSLTACSGPAELTGPDPDEAADALAGALASGDFGEVALAGEQTTAQVGADYAAVIEGMGDLTPTVTAGEVEEQDGQATATLAWMWPVAGDEWSYTTPVTLTEADD